MKSIGDLIAQSHMVLREHASYEVPAHDFMQAAAGESPLAAAYHVCDKAALENRISNQAARIAELEATVAKAEKRIRHLEHVARCHRQILDLKYGETSTDAIRRLQAELATLRAQASELEGDVDELAFCEGCGGSCGKMPENDCYPPRWCHRCYQELMKQVVTLRAQAERDAAIIAAYQGMLEECEDGGASLEAGETYPACPICKEATYSGHAKNCRLKALLNAAVRARRDAGNPQEDK